MKNGKDKICWIDVETSGLDPVENDVIQLACLVEIGGEVVAEQNLFMRPGNGAKIDAEALKVNARTMEDLEGYPPAKEGLKKLRKTLGRYVGKYDKKDKFVPAGYYVNFDLDFLRAAFVKAGDKYFGSWFFTPAIDVRTFIGIMVAKYGLRLKNYKLATVCEAFNVPIKAHDALSDIKATRMLYQALGKLR